MRIYLRIVTTGAVLFGMSTVGLAQGLDTRSSELPPDGIYVSPAEYHEYAAAGIILDDPIDKPFVETTVWEPMGDDEFETFDSEFTAVEIGMGVGPVTLTGPVQVLTTDRLLSTTGTFDTEIVSMSLSGTTPMGDIMIRQDPTRASLGQTHITDLGGGLYHIDSFFDVFTELSVDGGASWIACDDSTHMYLIAEPAGPIDWAIESCEVSEAGGGYVQLSMGVRAAYGEEYHGMVLPVDVRVSFNGTPLEDDHTIHVVKYGNENLCPDDYPDCSEPPGGACGRTVWWYKDPANPHTLNWNCVQGDASDCVCMEPMIFIVVKNFLQPVEAGEFEVHIDSGEEYAETDETNNYCYVGYQPPPIPTVSQWGLIVLAVLVVVSGVIVVRRRRKTAAA